MDDERCYICKRTLDEVKEAMTEVLQRFDEANDSQYQKVLEARKKIVEIDSYIKNNNICALNQLGLAGMGISKELLDKYGSWSFSKYHSALECDYPFLNDEKEVLGTIFSSMNNKKAAILITDKTIEEFFNESKTKYEEYAQVADQPVDETHASVKSCHGDIDVKMNYVEFGTIPFSESNNKLYHGLVPTPLINLYVCRYAPSAMESLIPK